MSMYAVVSLIVSGERVSSVDWLERLECWNVGDGLDLSPDDATFGGTTGCLLSCIHALPFCQKPHAVSPKLKVTV